MNIIKFGFCFGLGFIAYHSFSTQDLKVLYELTVNQINKCVPFLKNIFINFNDLLSATQNFNDLSDQKLINQKIQTLQENIQKINEQEMRELQFHKHK